MNKVVPSVATTDAALHGRIQRLRKTLDHLRARLEHEVGPLTGSFFPGEIRSRLRMLHGLEREIPDVFRPGDDARQIDVRHLPASLTISSLETAIARQEVRRERYTHYSDTELILVLDLSLSMLTGQEGQMESATGARNQRISNVHSGSLSPEGPPDKVTPGDKLWGLYLAANVFLTLGEQAGFVLRAVFARDGQAPNERALHPRHFRFAVLERLSEELIQAYGRAERNPANHEKDSLLPGLQAALEVRTRSAVVVVSDFLDPVARYRNSLLEIAGRHHLVLVDVANWWERAFPMPPSIFEVQPLLEYRNWIDAERRDVARRVEEGTEPRPLRVDQIRNWNKQVSAWQRELQALARRFGAGYCKNFEVNNVRKAIQLASQHLDLVGGR